MTGTQRVARAVIVGLAWVAVGCSSMGRAPGSPDAPTPAPSSTVPTPPPSVTASSAAPTRTPPGPTDPPPPALGVGRPTARAEGRGLVIELWLDRTTVGYGQRLHALARVSNQGTQTFTREGNDCGGGPAPIAVRVPAALAEGRRWTGLAAEVKRRVLLGVGVDGQEVDAGSFQDVDTVDDPHAACTAHSEQDRFRPGDSDEMSLAWDATAPEGIATRPGEARLVATFQYWPRDDLIMDIADARELTLETTLRIQGSVERELTIVDYADAAIEDGRLVRWVEDLPPEAEWTGGAQFWPNPEGEHPPQPPYAGATDGAVDIDAVATVDRSLDPIGVKTVVDTATGKVLGFMRLDPSDGSWRVEG